MRSCSATCGLPAASKPAPSGRTSSPSLPTNPRYRAMLGQSGSTALDLFWDRLEEEEREIRNKRYVALDVLEASALVCRAWS